MQAGLKFCAATPTELNPMRTILVIAALAALAACGQPSSSTEATTADAAAHDAAPANAMAEADAVTAATAAGYTDVVDLAPNPDGSWSATGTKDGAATQITISASGVAPTVPLE
jgi:hypothetical protein